MLKKRPVNYMRTIRDIRIKNENGYLITINLKRIIGRELKLLIKKEEENQYLRILDYLIHYFTDNKPVINNGQTIAYHSWLLKFIIVAEIINVYEVQPNGDGFIEGVDYAIGVVTAQERECVKHNATSLFPLFSQMVVISKGVLEGKDVDAVRYPSPSQMTGWWITTELYDDNIESLETIHFYHLAFKRPDIMKYLALSFGFRFQSGHQDKVWFDEKILS
jgi:hypothetical protein